MQTALNLIKKDYLTNGLSEYEALERLKKHGPNELKHEKGTSVLKLILAQFGEFMVLLLSAATLASAIMGDYIEAAAIAAIIILNAILGFFQEFRTEKTLEALKQLAAPETQVTRGGVVKRIAATEVVPGDVLVLEAGERIPADSTVYEASGLRLDESLLTGESLPISKFKKDKVYMGTMIVNGNGLAVASETGMQTEMGGIASLLQMTESSETPLQKRLDKMGKVIAICCVAICLIVVILGVIRGEPVFDMLLSGISLAVAAVPEGMPAIVSVALAIGVRKMLVRRALIRRLPAVETLGCATIICSDKTGTITQNKMVARKVLAYGKLTEIPDHGYSKVAVSNMDLNKLKEFTGLGVLCCNYKKSKKGRKSVLKSTDPTENAFIDLGYKLGVDFQGLLDKYKRIYEIPFDSEKKRMSVVCLDNNGNGLVIMKGGCDVVLRKCSKIQSGNQPIRLNSTLSIGVLTTTESMASEALRMLAVAVKPINIDESEIHRLSRSNSGIEELNKKIECDLTFLGIIGMMDPPRKEAVDSIKKCKTAGIRTIMITGDHKATAVAIAGEVGIASQDLCLTGEQLDKLDDEKLSKEIEKVNVFARVSPRHKLRIVKVLKSKGHVVAMTGDGVNDAPAVSEADIGIAMGKDGTDVTREAAAMVLMDDNFATITAAVEEGRVIYSNIRKFIRYLLACNIGEVFSVFITMLFGFPLPLLPIQVLWVNLVTDGLPALALGFEPAGKDIMEQPPRKKNEGIFAGGLGYLIFTRGILIGICTVGVFMYSYIATNDIAIARTAAFMILIFAQLVHVFECKSERRTLFGINIFNNFWLILSVLISFGLTVMLVYFEQLHGIFRITYLPMDIWVLVGIITVLLPLVGGLMTKTYYCFLSRTRLEHR